MEPLTPVRDLSVTQLQSVLRARGVQLPAYTQTQSFYLDLCRKHGIHDVPASELGGQQPTAASDFLGSLGGNAGAGSPRVETMHTIMVRELSVSQLQTVLRARGVQLPAYTQTQSFYLDLCRKHGISDVPASELDGGATTQQATTTPVRDLSISQLQTVLRARRVQLPAYTQTQSFYLDLCRKNGINEVPTSELGGGATTQQATTTPVRELSVSQLQTVLRARGVQLPAYTQTQSFYLDLCRKHGINDVPDMDNVLDKRNWEPSGAPWQNESVFDVISGNIDVSMAFNEPDWWKLGSTLSALLQTPEFAGPLMKMKMPPVPTYDVIASFGPNLGNDWKKNYSEEKRADKYQEAFFKKMMTSHAEASDFALARRSQQFSALSESIENVKEKLTDAEYKAIYDAALGVHQLTVDEVDE